MAETSRQFDTAVDLVTPENIAFRYHIAGPFQRLWPYLIDCLLRATFLGALLIAWKQTEVGGVVLGQSALMLTTGVGFLVARSKSASTKARQAIAERHEENVNRIQAVTQEVQAVKTETKQAVKAEVVEVAKEAAKEAAKETAEVVAARTIEEERRRDLR